MDISALARELATGLASPEEVGCSAFPADGNGSGNENNVLDQCVTHTSHISHSGKVEAGIEDIRSSQVCMRAGASSRASTHFKGVGNVGSVGNASHISRLHFPPLSSELGKRRESGKLGLQRPLSGTQRSAEARPEALTFDERAAFLEYECGLTRDQAEAQARAEIEAADVVSIADGLPPTDGLSLWRAGLALLSPHQVPCPDYRPGVWSFVHGRALAFLDAFGEQAEALGWTASRLFGVHPEIGTARVDYCGGLVLGVVGQVCAITGTEIRFGHLTHRTKPGQPAGVPIWRFGR